MRYYIIAGEASGDLHGSGLVRELRIADSSAVFRAWGGDKMEAAGAPLVKHYRDLAFMGFVEVVKHLGTILKNIKFAKSDILSFKPDVLILIDYPGFNLRIAKWAKEQGIRVVYYISPQVWAWKEGRAKAIKRDVDQMLVILPFEVDFYKKWGMEVAYVGHPLVEVVDTARKSGLPAKLGVTGKPLIALLPGSREQEIRTKLPIMLSVVDAFPDYEFAVAMAPSQGESLYREVAGGKPITLVAGQTYELLRQSRAALVTSGTATLETALFGVPQIVCYKGHPASYWLAKKLIKVKYISLVNLILDRPVVPELIQDDLNTERLIQELQKLLPEESTDRRHMQECYAELWNLLGSRRASERTVELILKKL